MDCNWICEQLIYQWSEVYNVRLSTPARGNKKTDGIDFSRQNLTSIDVRFWRLESIHKTSDSYDWIRCPRCNANNKESNRQLL